MKIKFIAPKPAIRAIKCTVHKNGKMGFSMEAIKLLNINSNCYIKLGVNEDDSKDTNLYLQVLRNESTNAYKVIKAGKYFYLNTRSLFDELKIDYNNKKIIYDIEKFNYEGTSIYQLNRREKDRKKTGNK